MLDENSVFYNSITFLTCKWYNIIYKIIVLSLAFIKKSFVNIITVTYKNETLNTPTGMK